MYDGPSPRCSDPTLPILADVEEVSDSQGSHCVASNATVGTRFKDSNGQMKKVTALYGTSPRCSNPTYPILVDVEAD